MKNKLLSAHTLVLLFGVAVLSAGDHWKEKPYTEWTQEDVARVLRHSPWAHEVILGRGAHAYTAPSPAPANRDPFTGVPTSRPVPAAAEENPENDSRSPLTGRPTPYTPHERTELVIKGIFFVQWASSLTCRQALVRQAELQGRLSQEDAGKILANRLDYYMISVYSDGFPLEFFALRQATVRESAYLEPERSKQKIPAATVFAKKGKQGVSLDFYFPRELEGRPVIGPRETKVKFHCQLKGSAIAADFDLSKMKRDGAPDL